MPVKYKIVEKAKPGIKRDNQADPIPAPVIVYSDTIDPDSFLKKFHEFSHMTKADIVRCLMSLQKFLIEELKDGNIVQTGIIGTFSPSVKKCKGEFTRGAAEFSINYRLDKIMKKELKNADLKRVR
jgi:hypothetical protein